MSNNKFYKSLWLQGDLELESPMIIGNGSAMHTDNDLLLDASGQPYIPGSAISGVVFSSLLGNSGMQDEEIKQLFGEHKNKNGKKIEHRQSMIIFHDALLKEDSRVDISIRDGIEINDCTKTAKNESKYNYEVLNPGATFVFRMEILLREQFSHLNIEQFVDDMLKMMEDDFRVGAKTSRGMGKLVLKNAYEKILKFNHQKTSESLKAMEEYINFDWKNIGELEEKSQKRKPEKKLQSMGKLEKKSQSNVEKNAKYRSPYTVIQVPLVIQSTLLIRDYFLNNFDVDCQQLTVDGKAVIPGSAWAGVFRHKAKEFLLELSDEATAQRVTIEIFGEEKEHTNVKKSRIILEEASDQSSQNNQNKSKLKEVTRNKIDRFTGGVLDTGLFSERVAVSGKFNLTLRLKNAQDYEIGVLLLVIREIQNGLVALGGTTSVGRGTFQSAGQDEILINGKVINESGMEKYWSELGKQLSKPGKE